MNIEVHIVNCNEREMLAYAIRHYATFASRIIVHDGGSTDGSRELAIEKEVELIHWETQGQINDTLLTKLKQEAWLGSKADWVIFVDADEFIYFPLGVETTLRAYDDKQTPIVKTYGYEMTSEAFPTTSGQIYEEVKHGGTDSRWYGKPALWSPRRVTKITFSAGAHDAVAVLASGGVFEPVTQPTIPTYLLHFKHLGPVERIGENYAAAQKRFSAANIQNRWGNHEDGLKHARDKRAQIMKTLQRIIP